MKFEDILKKYRLLPVIDTENLFTGTINIEPVKVQISRWTKAGKLIQLKKGFYIFSHEYRAVEPFGPYIAGLLIAPSYISCEKALEFHGLIPEGVGVYTSVTPKRQAQFSSPEGVFEYRHIKKSLFWGYGAVSFENQTGFIATPEKALLDFFYFKGIHVSLGYLEEMRLQNLDAVNTDTLHEYALRFQKPGIISIAKQLAGFIRKELHGMKVL